MLNHITELVIGLAVGLPFAALALWVLNGNEHRPERIIHSYWVARAAKRTEDKKHVED